MSELHIPAENARCPDCGTTHFTLLQDKRCQRCVDAERIKALQRRIKELEAELASVKKERDMYKLAALVAKRVREGLFNE